MKEQSVKPHVEPITAKPQAEPILDTELELFKYATNWKEYWSSFLRQYIRGNVLDVGAGIGSNRQYFQSPDIASWTFLEPDPKLASQIQKGSGQTTLIGTLDAIEKNALYDSILYIDVLEHIEDDVEEARRAMSHLTPGGHLLMVVPAHQWLFSNFDARIGHMRRYNKRMLMNVIPPQLKCRFVGYLDSTGLLLSLGNRLLLRQSIPTLRQIYFWDKKIIPISKKIDSVIGYRVGKTVMGIWQKPLESFSS